MYAHVTIKCNKHLDHSTKLAYGDVHTCIVFSQHIVLNYNLLSLSFFPFNRTKNSGYKEFKMLIIIFNIIFKRKLSRFN